MNSGHVVLKLLSAAVLIIAVLFLETPDTFGAQRLAVKAKIANVRYGPGINYEILWQVEKYHPIKVIGRKGRWYRFKDFEGDTGWISKRLVKKISAVITKKGKCNIRSGPGTKYRILFVAEKGIPFRVIKRKGNWIRIQHADGDKGWIYRSLVW
jgi:SH3-like domain-containing protein